LGAPQKHRLSRAYQANLIPYFTASRVTISAFGTVPAALSRPLPERKEGIDANPHLPRVHAPFGAGAGRREEGIRALQGNSGERAGVRV